MSLAAERAFRASLKSRAFERVYYLYGEDAFLAAGALRDLIDAAVEPATRDFNLDVRDAASLDAGGLGSLLGTPPMMAARRVIVVRDVGALRKDAREVLDAYVASPAADVVLVLMGAFGEQAKADKALAARASQPAPAPSCSKRSATIFPRSHPRSTSSRPPRETRRSMSKW